MLKKLAALALLPFWATVVCGKATTMADALRAVENNNGELKAFVAWTENQRLQLRAENNLPDPQFGTYYLPLGTHTAGNYVEFEVTQSAEFPSVYRARREWIESRNASRQLVFDSLRQSILLAAKNHCLDLIHLNKRLTLERERLEQARQLYEQIQTRFEAEQIGILDVNKAKVAWLQQQFTIQRTERARQETRSALQQLNGGLPLDLTQTEFSDSLSLPALEPIWTAQQAADPALILTRQEEEVAQRHIELTRKQQLPGLTAGLNYQGVGGDNYFGLYGGIRIPLWSQKHRLPAAEAAYAYRQARREGVLATHFVELQSHYSSYENLLAQYREYQTTLGSLESENLLLQAYELEQISFATYYTERQFYRQAQDELLVLEKELQIRRAEIFKYQL